MCKKVHTATSDRNANKKGKKRDFRGFNPKSRVFY